MTKTNTPGAEAPGEDDSESLDPACEEYDFDRLSPESLTEDERDYIRVCVRRSQRTLIVKECFCNSQAVLLGGDEAERLTYWEGRARSPGERWYHHGWLTISDSDKVVDLTLGAWEQLQIEISVPDQYRLDPKWKPERPEERRIYDEYEGRPFHRDDVRKHVARDGLGNLLFWMEIEMWPERKGAS